ncbi:NAD(P)-binding protein [Agrocybe pediades]|nr:NAD(P)-binding protein [Agrocybe pediades]
MFDSASGFIGLPTAQALVRAGHYVIGLTRSQAKAKLLAAEEIVPLIGEVDKPEEWIKVIADLDAIIEIVGGTAKQLVSQTLEFVTKVTPELRPAGAPKLTYIYTSGTWVHGENRTDIVTDTTPLRSPAQLVAWRPACEQAVVKNTTVNGIVIRPALLYGRAGSLLAPFFKSASEGKVWYPGTPGGRFALVHCDDLADLYVRAVERSSLVAGQIFDAANDFTESVDDVLNALAKASGATSPPEYREPANLYEVALGTTHLIRPYLARSLLGWRPSKPGLVDGMPIYYAAWKATQE